MHWLKQISHLRFLIYSSERLLTEDVLFARFSVRHCLSLEHSCGEETLIVARVSLFHHTELITLLWGNLQLKRRGEQALWSPRMAWACFQTEREYTGFLLRRPKQGRENLRFCHSSCQHHQEWRLTWNSKPSMKCYPFKYQMQTQLFVSHSRQFGPYLVMESTGKSGWWDCRGLSSVQRSWWVNPLLSHCRSTWDSWVCQRGKENPEGEQPLLKSEINFRSLCKTTTKKGFIEHI